MCDYSKGQIYKITCETGKIYIGSTVKKLNQRLCEHKNKSNNCVTKHFINPKIELIELYPCKTKNELLWRERAWFDTTPCVNNNRPITTPEERKALISEKDKIYWEKTKAERNKKIDCECGGKYCRRNKLEHYDTLKHKKYLTTLV